MISIAYLRKYAAYLGCWLSHLLLSTICHYYVTKQSNLGNMILKDSYHLTLVLQFMTIVVCPLIYMY